MERKRAKIETICFNNCNSFFESEFRLSEKIAKVNWDKFPNIEISKRLVDINDIRESDFKLNNYISCNKITAEMIS